MALIVIGFLGLSVFGSTYVDESIDLRINKALLQENTLHSQKNGSNSMKLCDWKIEDLQIQDMILFAALAYE